MRPTNRSTNWPRMNRTRLVAMLVLFCLLATLLSACGTTPTKGEVIVYVAVPLSGWQANGGQTVVGGARLAADEINRQGGLLGHRVVIVPIDDEADSDVAVTVANQVAEALRGGEQRVLGVIGHYNSGQTAAALQVYGGLPLIVVTPTASATSLTEGGLRNFFRVNATDDAQAPFDAAFMVNELGAQRIVLVYAENEYGQGLRDGLVPALTALERPPVEVIGIEEAADTHADAIPRIRNANPDLVFLAGYETEGYVLLPEIREAGIEATFMASDACFLYDFIDGSGVWAEGAYVSGITPDPKAVTDEAWWKAYQALEHRNPGTYSIAGYSAMAVIAAGAKKAGTLDAAAISEALRQTEISTLVGDFTYDEKGDMSEQRIYVFQVRDGDFVQVAPSDG